MPNTYVALATQTLSSDTATITFSSIPATYTDLVLVATIKNNSGGSRAIQVLLNNDTATNYSTTDLQGNGTSAASTRSTGTAYLDPSVTCPGTEFANLIMHFQNYVNTTTYKTVLNRNGAAGTNVRAVVSLWRSTAAITSIKFQLGGADLYSTGSTFNLYGIANADQGAAKATGGIITEDSQYWYHTFGASGTFTPKQALTCDYLVVAGGGGGSGYFEGGGGGAGGLRSTVGTTGGGGSLETALSLTTTGYTVTIGAGGAGGAGGASGSIGNNSVFSTITSSAGGFGGNAGASANGGNGGSGGGTGRSLTAGTGTTNQGFAGGAGDGGTTSVGGGGGAGQAGAAASGSNGGKGGDGVSITALATTTGTGVNNYYAGGGGGSSSTNQGAGGAGGGGAGASANGVSATANTGSGGGGSRQSGTGGAGGSGIVIVRYLKA